MNARQHVTKTIITAGILAACMAIAGAPTAAAGPAPSDLETVYVLDLVRKGINLPTDKHKELAIQMGYLACKLDMMGGALPKGTDVYLETAFNDSLCNYVSVNGEETEAQRRQDLANQVRDLGSSMNSSTSNGFTQGILSPTPGDLDGDGDGVANSVDNAPCDYNPGPGNEPAFRHC